MSQLSTLIAAIALAAAGVATAQTAAPLSREAVIADLVAARNSGELATIQGEKGVETTARAADKAGAVATSQLPRQAVLMVKPTALREPTTAALAADHGENAARELGDFPAPILRRASAMASR